VKVKVKAEFTVHVFDQFMPPNLYPLASLEQIENSPSRADGIPALVEENLRAYGSKLIQQAGVLLKQSVSSTFLVAIA
jgi:hypothetical protein